MNQRVIFPRTNTIVITGILLSVSVLFVTTFSYTTSPLFRGFGDYTDSSVFQVIGKYWAKGAIPYKELWDMKGPYIFLVNAIGYGLTGTKHGVWAVQSVFMFFSSLALFRIFRLYFASGRSMCLTLLSLAALSYTYSGGNLTEEYVLPWLLFSFYNVELWEKRNSEGCKKAPHSPSASILYGITSGLSLMSRLTNVLALAGVIFVIALMLIHEKNYRNLYQNSMAFLAGFILSSLPFFLFFMYHQTLQQMLNATFAYAVEYAWMSSLDSLSNGIHYFALSYIGSILLLLVTFFRMFTKRHADVYSWLWLAAAGLPFVWFCLGNGYGHYGMIVLPLFAIALTQIEMFSLSKLRTAIVVAILIGSASKLLFVTVMFDYENTDLKDYRAGAPREGRFKKEDGNLRIESNINNLNE